MEEHPLILKLEGYSFKFNRKTLKFEPDGAGRIYLINKMVIECNLQKVRTQLDRGNFYRIGLMVYPEGKIYEGEINN